MLEPIIFVMGMTGVGKSSFVRAASESHADYQSKTGVTLLSEAPEDYGDYQSETRVASKEPATKMQLHVVPLDESFHRAPARLRNRYTSYGGGVRGLSSLITLGDLLSKVRSVENLIRHRVDVRWGETQSTPLKRCFCAACERPDENWPRIDNFRSHLARIHMYENHQCSYCLPEYGISRNGADHSTNLKTAAARFIRSDSKRPEPRPQMMNPDDDDDDDTIGFHRPAGPQNRKPSRKTPQSASDKSGNFVHGYSSGGAIHENALERPSHKSAMDAATISLWRGVIARTCGQISGSSTVPATSCAGEVDSLSGMAHQTLQMSMANPAQFAC